MAIRKQSENTSELQQESGLGRFVENAKNLMGPPLPPIIGSDWLGDFIGPYHLQDVLGEGGMGKVYLAQQLEPVQRKVALKVIKPGTGSREVIARFETERQALAMMQHPNIAAVIDAGTTENGLPYFVMELISGSNIIEYCDQHRLDMTARLKLFAAICRAVHHAHQKGIIHRDLKPGNVLVTEIDGQAIPKIIDFGVAKALETAVDSTTITRFNQVVGTPLYMSPEQAGFGTVDVDTRSDIYSLGMILYKLLTGSTPIDRKQFPDATWDQFLHWLQNEEPLPPSRRFAEMPSETQSQIALARSTTPIALESKMQGELDWITAKALEKERELRFASANDLALDVERFLDHQPVAAGPHTPAYYIRKFVRRNRLAVATAAMLGLLLTLGIAGTTTGWLTAARAQKLAKDRETGERLAKEQAIRDRQQALTLADRNSDIISIVTGSFQSVGPSKGSNADMLASEVLFNAREKMQDSDLDDEGRVALLASLTRAFLDVGAFSEAVSTAREEVAIRERLAETTDLSSLQTLHHLAAALAQRGDLPEALEIGEFVYQARIRLNGHSDNWTLESANNLAEFYRMSGNLEKAIEIGRDIIDRLEKRKNETGRPSENLLVTMNNIAEALHQSGDLENAIDLVQRTVKQMQVHLGEDYPQTLNAMQNYGVMLISAGKLEESRQVMEEVYPLMLTKLGELHPLTLAAMSNLGVVYVKTDRIDEALPLYRKAAEGLAEVHGDHHYHTITAQLNLGDLYRKRGRVADAAEVFERLFQISTEALGNENQTTILVSLHLGHTMIELERYDEAVDILSQTHQVVEKKLPDSHPFMYPIKHTLAVACEKAGQFQPAITLLQELTMRHDSSGKKPDRKYLGDKSRLANVYESTGRLEESLAIRKGLIQDYQQEFGRDHHKTLFERHKLASTLLDLEQYEEAASNFRELHQLESELLGEGDPRTFASRAGQGISLMFSGQTEEGQALVLPVIDQLTISLQADWVNQRLQKYYLKNGDLTAFRQLMEKYLAQVEDAGDDASTTDRILLDYGRGLLLLEDYDDAAMQLQTALEQLENSNPSDLDRMETELVMGAALLGSGETAEGLVLLDQSFDVLQQRQSALATDRQAGIGNVISKSIEIMQTEGLEDQRKRWEEKLSAFRAIE